MIITPSIGRGNMSIKDGLKELEKLGLNTSEVKVYFALLKMGKSTVGPLITEAGVPDSKIYVILDKLKARGLASAVIENNVKHFQAADPQALLRLIDQQVADLNEQKERLQKEVIPAVKRTKETEPAPEATAYSSYAGMKSAFDYLLFTLQPGEEYQVFMLKEALEDAKVVSFFRTHHKRRQERKIRVRLIGPVGMKAVIEKQHKYLGMVVRYSKQALPVGVFIFKDNVMTLLWTPQPVAFVIKSRANWEHYKKFFEDVWARSKSS